MHYLEFLKYVSTENEELIISFSTKYPQQALQYLQQDEYQVFSMALCKKNKALVNHFISMYPNKSDEAFVSMFQPHAKKVIAYAIKGEDKGLLQFIIQVCPLSYFGSFINSIGDDILVYMFSKPIFNDEMKALIVKSQTDDFKKANPHFSWVKCLEKNDSRLFNATLIAKNDDLFQHLLSYFSYSDWVDYFVSSDYGTLNFAIQNQNSFLTHTLIELLTSDSFQNLYGAEILYALMSKNQFSIFLHTAMQNQDNIFRVLIKLLPTHLKSLFLKQIGTSLITFFIKNHNDINIKLMMNVFVEQRGQMGSVDANQFLLSGKITPIDIIIVNSDVKALEMLFKPLLAHEIEQVIAYQNFVLPTLLCRRQEVSLLEFLIPYFNPMQFVLLLPSIAESMPQDVFNFSMHQPHFFNLAHQSSWQPLVKKKLKVFVTTYLDKIADEYFEADIEGRGARYQPMAIKSALIFNVLRYVVLEYQEAYLQNFRYILSIPSIRSKAHQSLYDNYPNELFYQALIMGIKPLQEILLEIPGVLEHAKNHDFYQEAFKAQYQLRYIAEHRESSMLELKPLEKQKIQKLYTRYEHVFKDKGGASELIKQLSHHLMKRYMDSPAKITLKNGKALNLPVSFDEFNALKLNQDDYKVALEAYYQHIDHTALRFITKPNFWMDENAEFFGFSSMAPAARWSLFEEYQELIAYLYLGVEDDSSLISNEIDLQGRLSHFITSLAEIGRAHNWDQSRLKKLASGHFVSEEYDDKKGDKPSCSKGIKRRLFNSLIGHVDMFDINPEHIEDELRDFVCAHFKKMLSTQNKTQVLASWERVLGLSEESPLEYDIHYLSEFNLNTNQKETFIAGLKIKYGPESLNDESLMSQIEKAFSLHVDETHLHRFYKYGWERFLQDNDSALIQASLFSNTSINSPKEPNSSNALLL